MFDVEKKTVTIKGVSYEIAPLSGKYLPKLYSLVGKLQEADKESPLKALSEKDLEDLYVVCVETMRTSYPDKQVDAFVAQNLMTIFPIVIEVNFGDAGTA